MFSGEKLSQAGQKKKKKTAKSWCKSWHKVHEKNKTSKALCLPNASEF